MATLNDIATYRRRIGDDIKADSDTFTGNGIDSRFSLSFNNVFGEQVIVNGLVVTTYSIDRPSGTVIFNAPITDGDIIKVSYSYAAYTDVEATAMIDAYGIGNASIEALKGLLASAARLYNYQQGATRADKNQVFQNLKDLLAIYSAENNAVNPDGSISGNLTIGKRTNEEYRPVTSSIADLSRKDDEYYG